MKAQISFTLLLWLLLSCSNPTTVQSKPESLKSEPPQLEQGQMLPTEATAQIGSEEVELEVAKTPQQQAMGLMYRDSLAPNRGMLFSFAEPRYARFWMKNVAIPLDMVFLREGKVMAIASSVRPCTTTPCPTYGPRTLVDQVIELRGGRATELGLKVGDSIDIEYFSEPQD